MPVLRSQRNQPLVLTADPINTSLVAAYSWASEDGSTADSNGKDHSGNNRHWTVAGTTPPVVATSGGKGRDTSNGRTVHNIYYTLPSLNSLGMAVGTGAFTISKRIRMPSVAPANTVIRSLGRLTSGAATAHLTWSVYEVVGTGYCWFPYFDSGASASKMVWNDAGNIAYAANSVSTLTITRSATGTVKFFLDGNLIKTVTGNTENFLATTNQATITGLYDNAGGAEQDFVLIDEWYWTRELTPTEVSTQATNPYSLYTNSAVADSITVASPTIGSSVGTNINISGTWAGSDTPDYMEASFNGGAFASIGGSVAGGNFSGVLPSQVAGTGSLVVRWHNFPAVTQTITNVTVTANSIAFTVPNTPATAAVPYRAFQRDGSNNATCRITGTYTGTPTSIESRWNGGAWTTLVASPTGGTFDATRTLSGVGQGSLDIRFGNATAVTASIPAVTVTDLYLVAGQSNHVGKGTNYVAPVAPAGNPTWVPIERDKAGNWKQLIDSAATKFDDGTGAIYAVQVDPTPAASYFGNLSTRLMAAGIPAAFIPCAVGSTAINAWAVNLATTQLYGAMVATATATGAKRVLWWQGETNCGDGTTRASYESSLNALINDWNTRIGGKWTLMNINATGNGVGSGGTTATDTGFLAINAAIANVAATNPNVAGIANMNGAFNNSVHYGTGSAAEVIEVGLRAFNALNGAYYARTVTVNVVDASGASLTNITGINWALYNEVTPNLLNAPASKGSGASINGVGVLTLVIPNTTAAVGGAAWLEFSTSDGTTTQTPAPRNFAGVVTVN